MEQPATLPILTARLRLRALEETDLGALTEIYQHPDVAHWIGPHTRQDVQNEIAHHIQYQATLGFSFWAVEDRATSRLIGDCGLQPLEHRGPEIELGYDFHPRVWGRGIATEAANIVMRYALGPLGLDRVVALVKPDHLASQRVLLKVGLRSAGTRLAYGEPMLLYESSSPEPDASAS